MKTKMKRTYAPPCVAATASVLLERDLLGGSGPMLVETAGQLNGGFYDAETSSTFNDLWD